MTVTILTGDVVKMLRTLPSNHFGCVVTSPPYWGLRDYGVEGQLGLEPTLAEHIAAMMRVFDEVRRVLHPGGVVWVNYGDCYATAPNGRSAQDTKAAGTDDRTYRDKPFSTVQGVLKPKDLCLIPARFAIAMQEAGWWVRSEITWAKPNPMPDSSSLYRPGVACEKIFMFAKSDESPFFVARDTGEVRMSPDLNETCPLITKPDVMAHRWIRLGHYYNAEAVRVERAGDEDAKTYRGGAYVGGATDNSTMGKRKVTGNRRVKMPDGWDAGAGAHGSKYRQGREKGATLDKQHGHSRRHEGFNARWDAMSREEQTSGGRALRNWEPAPTQVWEIATKPFRESHFATFPPELVARCLKAGCPPGLPVLDPFGGSGTTGLVANAFGHDCTLIEINPEYAELARARLATGLVKLDKKASPPPAVDGLFAIKGDDNAV